MVDGCFKTSHLVLPGYDDMCQAPERYILAASRIRLRGDPWQPDAKALVGLVIDVLTEIQTKLMSMGFSTPQETHAWVHEHRHTLVLVGVNIAQAVKLLWQTEGATDSPASRTLVAIEHAVSALIREYPRKAYAIQDWYLAYKQFVVVLGVSITTVLMRTGALANPGEIDANSYPNQEEATDGLSTGDDIDDADLNESDESSPPGDEDEDDNVDEEEDEDADDGDAGEEADEDDGDLDGWDEDVDEDESEDDDEE